MSSLPCGVTDSMCDGYNPKCARCGHTWDMHYETDKELEIRDTSKPLNEEGDFEYNQIEYDANGEVAHACDAVAYTDHNGIRQQCECMGWAEGSWWDYHEE